MKKISMITFALSATLLIASCGGDDKGESTQTGRTSSKAEKEKWSSCFNAYHYDLQKILSKEDVLRHIDAAHHAQVKNEFKNRQNSMSEVVYSYPSDRTHTVSAGNITHSIPDNNIIMLKGLSFSQTDEEKSLENFNRKYKTLTDEEFQEMKNNMEKNLAGKPKEELATALKLAEARKGFNSTAVAGLGTAAYWKNLTVQGHDFGVELFVLAGKVELTVQVKVEANDEVNAQTAIAIAKDILEKCQ